VIAVDIAILPPPSVARLAIDLSASLPADQSQGLRLGVDDYLPHITLLQQLVNEADLDALLTRVGEVVCSQRPLALRITGAAMGSSSVWMAIERTPALVDLHTHVLDAALPFHRGRGDASAFVGGDARDRDVQWATGYRTSSSGDAFDPHITLGHAVRPPVVEPLDFEATTIAACHLGRFCSCRRALREWHIHTC
jgi:2'-5' RNA ligase superfamily protein